MKKPASCTKKHLDFLDKLIEDGKLDMFELRRRLMNQYPDLIKRDAMKIVSYWMRMKAQENK